MTVTEPDATSRTTDLPDHIVFYDGVCVMCNDAVRALMDLDTKQRLHFAPLQGATARRVGIDWDDDAPADEATFRFVDTTGDEIRISERMTAVADELAAIDRLPLVQWWIRATPPPVADAVYRFIAANRYRWFGRYDECRVPTPAERARFLD